jgi:hypothetical protein
MWFHGPLSTCDTLRIATQDSRCRDIRDHKFPAEGMHEGHPRLIGRDKRAMSQSEEIDMQDRGPGEMPVPSGCGNLLGGQSRGMRMGLRRLCEIPCEYLAGRMAAEEHGVVGGEGEGCDRSAVGGWRLAQEGVR